MSAFYFEHSHAYVWNAPKVKCDQIFFPLWIKFRTYTPQSFKFLPCYAKTLVQSLTFKIQIDRGIFLTGLDSAGTCGVAKLTNESELWKRIILWQIAKFLPTLVIVGVT